MMNWVSLAESILEAEFPSFGVLYHFATALHLAPQHERIPQSSMASLKILGKKWKLDTEPCLNSRLKIAYTPEN